MSGSVKDEIERKFLLASDAWRAEVTSSDLIVQVYLASTATAQVRLRRYGTRAYLTVKGKRQGLARPEIETDIPPDFVDAVVAAGLCPVPPLVKTRHLVPVGPFCFEIDEYGGDNQGLITAEIELPVPDADFPRPDWLGAEVSSDVRYGNVYLAQNPYQSW